MDIVKLARTVTWAAAGVAFLFFLLAVFTWSTNDDAYGYFGGGFIILAVGSQLLHVITEKHVKREKERDERLKKFYGGEGGCS